MEKIEIGKIVKPQGVKGDVKVVLFADNNFDFARVTQVFVENIQANIQKIYTLSDGCYGVKFDIIESRNIAESYRGKPIFVDKNKIELQSGRYFIADLIGKTAELNDGTVVGKITDIQNFGSADVIYIKGTRQVLCSHLDGLIINIADNKVVFAKEVFQRGAVYED